MACEYPYFIARFYDTIYHQVRDGVDNLYFLEKAGQCNGKILEAGVGTGRLFIASLDQGSDIYGIDISPSMLDVLRGKLNPVNHQRISLQDIRSFSMPFKFNLVIAPFHMMMHLLTTGDQLQALNNVYDNLEPGGTFIFDMFVPDLKLTAEGLKNITDFDEEYAPGKRLRRIVSTDPDLITQTLNVHFRLVWDEDDGEKEEEWHVPMRFAFRYELEHLAERSKFEHYHLYGDYEEGELDSQSREFVLHCLKKA